MKIGDIFSDDFVVGFSLSKDEKFGYTPASPFMAQAGGECVRVECDPAADTRWPCERQCFSDPDECRCRCGKCEGTYCDCEDLSGNSIFGYFEDYQATFGAYNFNQVENSDQVENRCYTPPASALATGANPPCNCRNCPGVVQDPDPNADPTVCCQKENANSFCIHKITGEKSPPNEANRQVEGGHIWKSYTQVLSGKICYRCDCPDGYESRRPTKYYCTIGPDPQCLPDVDGPYTTMDDCNAAKLRGECAERWQCKTTESGCEQTANWKAKFKSEPECVESKDCEKDYYRCVWNRHAFDFECEKTKNEMSASGARWYDSEEECEAAISGSSGHCATGWACRSGGLVGLPTECRRAPSNPTEGQRAAGAGKPVWGTKAECQRACCVESDYGEALGQCMWYEYQGPGIDGMIDFVHRCDIMSRSECAKKDTYCADGITFGCEPKFTCCGQSPDILGYQGCDCGDYNGTSCPAGSPDCGDNFRKWLAQPNIFGGSTIESCGCTQAPSQQPVYE